MGESALQLDTSLLDTTLWHEVVNTVHAIYNNSDANDQLTMLALGRLVQEIYPSIINNPVTAQALRDCPLNWQGNQPGWFTTLFENSQCQVNLLAVYQDQPIPLHDHPGCQGFSVVLSGRARIQHARVAVVDEASGIAEIVLAGVEQCEEQQLSYFSDQEGSLHSIESLSAYSQMLVFHMPPVVHTSQSLYFPMEDKIFYPGQCIYSKRIRMRGHTGY